MVGVVVGGSPGSELGATMVSCQAVRRAGGCLTLVGPR